eukprot:3936259-Rhodomonas_salina.1
MVSENVSEVKAGSLLSVDCLVIVRVRPAGDKSCNPRFVIDDREEEVVPILGQRKRAHEVKADVEKWEFRDTNRWCKLSRTVLRLSGFQASSRLQKERCRSCRPQGARSRCCRALLTRGERGVVAERRCGAFHWTTTSARHRGRSSGFGSGRSQGAQDWRLQRREERRVHDFERSNGEDDCKVSVVRSSREGVGHDVIHALDVLDVFDLEVG